MPDDELEELRGLGRAASVERVHWDVPPGGLWERIAAEAFADLASPDAASDEPVEALPEPPAVAAPVPITRSVPDTRPSRTRWWLAAAALVVVAVGGVVALTRSSASPTVVASTELELLGATGSGTAELLDADGSLQLRLVTSDVEAPDGFTEVWLINTELTELVSLGPIRDDQTYALPAGIDPTVFPIVDVSFEPLDGDPTHSGDSVFRGELTF